MEQPGRATWTAKPHRVVASESGDERVQTFDQFWTDMPVKKPEMFRFAQHDSAI